MTSFQDIAARITRAFVTGSEKPDTPISRIAETSWVARDFPDDFQRALPEGWTLRARAGVDDIEILVHGNLALRVHDISRQGIVATTSLVPQVIEGIAATMAAAADETIATRKLLEQQAFDAWRSESAWDQPAVRPMQPVAA